MVEECDVLVIGGGPAGSTAAALLAGRGRDVVLLEKDQHPRFHIGESLLPANLPLFDRLGVHAAVAAMGVYKPGAEFVSDDTGKRTSFPFTLGAALAGDGAYSYSYQVNRAEFDDTLFRNARSRGARAAERTRVTEITFGAPGARARVVASGPDGESRVLAPRFVLDGSGRDTFIAGKLRLKDADKRNNTAALFAQFKGVERRGEELEGYVSVHLVDDGWFWMIPLPDDVMSVGFVGDQRGFKSRGMSKDALFLDRLARSPTVTARMAGAARVSDIVATGNYSYRARAAWGDGWFLIGDAFAFVDPMFSSGVLLAMTAGELGADVAGAWLDSPRAGRRAARRAAADLRGRIADVSWLVHRINDPVLRAMFMTPSNALRMRDGLVTLLAGNAATDWRRRLPTVALKMTFRALSLARRLGVPIALGGADG